MTTISTQKDLVALGATLPMERPLEITEVIVTGEIAKALGIANNTKQVLFVVVADEFTSKKGNKYARGTYWFSNPQ